MPRLLHHPRCRRRQGTTLLELGVAITIAGILLALVVPGFNRVIEQNHLDNAAQYLRSIWSAQRVYWLENRTFASSLADLDSLGLIDPKIIAGSDGYYTYSITAADAESFTAKATRTGSGAWSGQLTTTDEGQIAGELTGSAGVVLVPPDF